MGVFKRLKWLFLGGNIGPDQVVLEAFQAQMLDLENSQTEFQKALWRIEQKINRHTNVDLTNDDELKKYLAEGYGKQGEAEAPKRPAPGAELTPEQVNKLIL